MQFRKHFFNTGMQFVDAIMNINFSYAANDCTVVFHLAHACMKLTLQQNAFTVGRPTGNHMSIK